MAIDQNKLVFFWFWGFLDKNKNLTVFWSSVYYVGLQTPQPERKHKASLWNGLHNNSHLELFIYNSIYRVIYSYI